MATDGHQEGETLQDGPQNGDLSDTTVALTS
jgi:hypothetical protein